jgi:hypothetical protein
MRGLAGISQHTVDQFDVVLLPAQDGNCYILSVFHCLFLDVSCPRSRAYSNAQRV